MVNYMTSTAVDAWLADICLLVVLDKFCALQEINQESQKPMHFAGKGEKGYCMQQGLCVCMY